MSVSLLFFSPHSWQTSDFTLNENVRGHPTRFELLGEKESLMFEAEVEAEKTVWTRDIWDLLFSTYWAFLMPYV